MSGNGNGDCMSFGKGIFWGALIGAGIALLYAPRRGAETRAMLKSRAMEMKQKAGEAVEQVKDVAGEAVDQVKDMAGEAVDQVKDMAGEAVDQVKDMAGEAVDQVKEKSAGMKRSGGETAR